MCVYVRIHVHFSGGRGEGWHYITVVNNIKEALKKIKSLERIPPNPGLLSQGAPVHTPPSFVSNVLPTWLPHTGIGHLSRPKAASNIGQLGVSQWYESVALKGSLHWVAPPRNSWGILKRHRHTECLLEVALSSEGTSASVLLGAGCWDFPESCPFLAGCYQGGGGWKKIC